MTSAGRTIQIFLSFGSPRGIKIAEITNCTVQAIYMPRHELNKASDRPELQNVGVYFLFGQGITDLKAYVYIGESLDSLRRNNLN